MKNEMKTFWTRTYQKRIGQMIGVCYRYVQDRATAEDLAHDAFLKAIEKADTYKGVGSFDKWLMRIAVNNALHYLRDQKTVGLSDQMLDEGDIPDTADESEELTADDMMSAIRKADFTVDEILAAISQLPEHHRVVFNLYVFERYSHKQIAELQGITVSTSKSHLLRARKELQQILFQQSKKKKRTLMTIFPLFIAPEAAIDSYCREQLEGFALPPLKPLSEKDFLFASGGRIPFRLWLRSHATHVTVGVAATGAAIATTSILLTSSPQENAVQQPLDADPQPVTVVADSAAVPLETPQELQEQPSLAPNTPNTATPRTISETSTSTTPEAVATADSLNAVPAAQQPVVIKKKRHTNRTVVIQNTEQ